MYTKSPQKPQLKTLAQQLGRGVDGDFGGDAISKM
jgi:hypothetical protein